MREQHDKRRTRWPEIFSSTTMFYESHVVAAAGRDVGLRIQKTASGYKIKFENISNNLSRRADNGGFPTCRLSGGLTTPHRKNMLRNAMLGLQRMHQNSLTYNFVYYRCRRLVFETCSVRILAGTPVILSSRGSPQFLRANAGIVLQLSYDGFLSNPFLFIVQFDATQFTC